MRGGAFAIASCLLLPTTLSSQCPSHNAHMLLSNHGELFAVMTELYTLFDDLVAIEPNVLRLPPSDTGVHPATVFDAYAAIEAGFTSEAVAVMSALPYLHTGSHTIGDVIEMLGSTCPLSYLEQDEGGFELSREIFVDDTIIPPSAFRLTWQNVYGWEYIYDTEKRLVYVWNPMGDDSEGSETPAYSHLQPVSPREAFQPLVDRFRNLRRLTPGEGHLPFETDEAFLWQPEVWTKVARDLYEADYKLWKALCKLADLYVECGWNVDAIAQTEFRREEFIDKRTEYMREVVGPLDEDQSKASDIFRLSHQR